MVIAIIIGLIIVYIIYSNIKRGDRFVRSYIYLTHYQSSIHDGNSVEEAINDANTVAMTKFRNKYGSPYYDELMIKLATGYAKEFCDGKQVPVISMAKELGFRG